MSRTPRDLFLAAAAFVRQTARPLDVARLHYHFAATSNETVFDALAAFQNPDGGFGRAIEPDLRGAGSSVIGTSTGLAMLAEVDAPAGHPLVLAALSYCLRSYDGPRAVWPIATRGATDGPHAPWWNYDDLEASFGGFVWNPTAAVLGHCYRFYAPENANRLGIDAALRLHAATDAMRARLRDGVTPDGQYDLMCAVGLADAPHTPEDVRAALRAALPAWLDSAIEKDPARWTEHGLPPLGIIPAPDHWLAAHVDPALIDANLDFSMATQQADGGWPVTWSWAFIDAEAWATAEREWRGHLAVNNLRTLRAFGRLTAADATLEAAPS